MATTGIVDGGWNWGWNWNLELRLELEWKMISFDEKLRRFVVLCGGELGFFLLLLFFGFFFNSILLGTYLLYKIKIKFLFFVIGFFLYVVYIEIRKEKRWGLALLLLLSCYREKVYILVL